LIYGNPLSLSQQRTKHTAPRINRYLEPALWQEVKNTIATLPRDTDRARAHPYRVRWLFTLLYLGGLRIAEVGANTMGQFFVRCDADGTLRWWLTVHGKGGKERLVPATRYDVGAFALSPATGAERTALVRRRDAAGFADWRNRSQ
jgi:integrase